MTKRRAIPVVVPQHIGEQCKKSVFPVLEARGINCRENGHSWLSSVIESEGLWAWVASVRIPKSGEVFDVGLPRRGSPKIHDVPVRLEGQMPATEESIRVEVVRLVGSQAHCRITKAEPQHAPPAELSMLMLSNQMVTLSAIPDSNRSILIADAVFANELMPMALLVQRPARLIQASQMGIATHVMGRSELGLGTACETCNSSGQVTCNACDGGGSVPCKVCHGSGDVECRRCSGRGTFTGKFGDEMPCGSCSRGMRECPYCHGDCTNNCSSCRGDGQTNCQDCHDSSGYRWVWWDNRTGRFDDKHQNELGQQPVVLVEWESGKAIPLESDWRSLFNNLTNETSGTAALSEPQAMRLADHARRLGNFEPLLQHLIEKQEVVEQEPVAFQRFHASAERTGGQVVYEFLLHDAKGSWVKEGVDPFPKGTQVLFVPAATSTWRDAAQLRWVEGFAPGTTDAKLEASYVGRRRDQQGVRLLISFPTAMDRESIPSQGFVLASQPPPSEKTQLDHLRAWCGTNNRLNPILRSVVFMDAHDTRPHKVKLRNETIRKTPSQLEAVRWGCSESPLVLVKGPPGTGKTTVIVEIIQQLAAQKRRVLLCSQTHQAVRNVLERLHGQKRIRMSRHQSGRDASLSDLEREYLAGAVADTFEMTTLERAQSSYHAARKRWEEDGAQLRALEAARDAATQLAKARQRLPQQHAEVDASVDQSILNLQINAEKRREGDRKQHDNKERKLRTRLTNLQQEREWASEMASALIERIQNLEGVATDPLASSPAADSQSDLDESDAVVGRRYRQLFLKQQRHVLRSRAMDAKVDSLQTELHTLNEKKESKIAHAEKKASQEIATINSNESEAIRLTKGEAAREREDIEEQYSQQLENINEQYKQPKESAQVNVTRAKKAHERTVDRFERTKMAKEQIADRYESIADKRPRMGEVGKRSWLKSKLPSSWVGLEELNVRYSVLGNKENTLKAQTRKLRAELMSLQSELDRVVGQEEQETADANTAVANDRQVIDKNEHRVLQEIQEKEERRRRRVMESRDKEVQAALSEWETKRGDKPETLESLQQEACLESRILGLTRDGLARLQSRISNRAKILKGLERQVPTEKEAVPDGAADPDEKTLRAQECRGDITHLRTRVENCESTETAVRNDMQANNNWLSEHLAAIDVGLQGDIGQWEKKRSERHAAVRVALEATERLCKERQSEALRFVDNSMSDDEPSDRWEALAAPIRPAALRLKAEFVFLERWVQDIAANIGAVRQLHWDNIDVFLSTCVGVASWRQLTAGGRDAVDTVIIDEAAHATVPETLIPMLYGKRCILIGDEMQLPPISMEEGLPPMPREEWISASETVNAEGRNRQQRGSEKIDTNVPLAENWLERSFFEWLYLYRSGLPRQMLDKQFRMHPDIAGFISQVFYPEGLDDGVTPRERRLTFGEHTEAVCLRPTDSIDDRFEEKVKKGFRNRCEADIVLQVLHDAEQNLDIAGYRQDLVSLINEKARKEPNAWPRSKVDAEVEMAMKARPTFGVITPYAHQKIFIQNKLRRVLPTFRNLQMSADDDVGSVDSYQGSERDVIIISFVRSPRKLPKACPTCGGKGQHDGAPCERCQGHGWEGANLQFVRDLRRLNVALSRAKRMLILVGNFSALVNPHYRGNDEGGRILDSLRRYIEDHGHVFIEHEAGYDP